MGREWRRVSQETRKLLSPAVPVSKPVHRTDRGRPTARAVGRMLTQRQSSEHMPGSGRSGGWAWPAPGRSWAHLPLRSPRATRKNARAPGSAQTQSRLWAEPGPCSVASAAQWEREAVVTAVRMRRPPSPTPGIADGAGGWVAVERAQDGRGRADYSEDPHHRRERGGQVQVRLCAAGLRAGGCGLLSRNGRRGPAGSAPAGRARLRPRRLGSSQLGGRARACPAEATRAQPAGHP